MRSKSRSYGMLAGVSFALCVAVLAPAPAAAAGLESELGPGVEVSRQDETGRVGFIGTEPGAAIDAGLAGGPRRAAREFVLDHARAFGVGGPSAALTVTESDDGFGKGTAVRLQQTHRGLPVLGGELVVNLDAGDDVLSVLGETSPGLDAPATAEVTADEAAAAAIGVVARDQDVDSDELRASAPKLQIYDPRLLGAPGPFQEGRTAWVLEVGDTGEIQTIRELVVVDAETGVVALHFSQIAEALDREVCDADNSPSDLPCLAPVWTEASRPAGQDADVVDAFEFAGDTYDFFAGLGRDSLDDAGMTLISTVDYCDELDDGNDANGVECPYPNAFWNGEQMAYGDGFAAADDVVGHELTHGFTEFSSSLFYYYQSGAINESMSDVFGELVDLTNGAGNDAANVRWLVGEDIPVIGAIRDMKDPTAFGDPDKMTSPNYTADPGERDAGGVHSNSGVSNKAAFLITDGETFNGETVTGIGLDKTAQIYYEVNNAMLTSASDYADLANALSQACTSLIGIGADPITASDCTEVDKAVEATEMDTDPPAAPATDLPAASTTCPGGATFTEVFFDDLEGPDNWTDPPSVWHYPNPAFATYASSGDTNFWGDDADEITDSAIAMTSSWTLPAGASLRFEHAYGFEDDPTHAYDGGVVEYSTDGGTSWHDLGGLRFNFNGYDGPLASGFGNPLSGREAFVRESNGYVSSRASLADLDGEDVRFRFRIGTDEAVGDYGWFVDDIHIYACQGGDTTPPQTTIVSGPADGSTIADPTPSFGFESNEVDSIFHCSVDGAPFDICTANPQTIGPLAEGPHELRVMAIDLASNFGASESRSFTVDTAPPAAEPPPDPPPPEDPVPPPQEPPPPAVDETDPVTSIDGGPKRKTTKRTARFEFSSNEVGTTFACKLTGKKARESLKLFVPCSSPKAYKRLKPGRYRFALRGTDAAGNHGATAIHSWKIKRP